jgi:hypothetical protein
MRTASSRSRLGVEFTPLLKCRRNARAVPYGAVRNFRLDLDVLTYSMNLQLRTLTGRPDGQDYPPISGQLWGPLVGNFQNDMGRPRP